MTRPVIFLDMDGVLVLPGPAPRPLDPLCLQRLRNLLAITNARVVISSAWGARAVPVLTRAGIGPILGITRAVAGPRGEQIGRWLSQHGRMFPDDVVTCYAILDDDNNMGDHLDRLVQTELERGFDDEAYNKALALLSR
jgi:hypothetical protein